MAEPIATVPSDEGLAAARKDWIGAQITYYEGAKQRHETAARRWKRVSLGALTVSIALALVFAVLALPHVEVRWTQGLLPAIDLSDKARVLGRPIASVLSLVQTLIGVAAAIGIAARAYLVRRADEDLVKQYAAALVIFESAKREFDRAAEALTEGGEPDWNKASVLERLGVEALTEHGEWGCCAIRAPMKRPAPERAPEPHRANVDFPVREPSIKVSHPETVPARVRAANGCR